jgi:DNA end-binding protein Ku
MAARSISTASISFGLVTIPVRVYPAVTSSAGISFHLLHKKDNVRLKQQYVCPADGEIVPRSEMVKGYEHAKDEYVTFDDEELKALDEQATHGIEIAEFLPIEAVDPMYFERAYYLGPDKGGDKPFALLSEAMTEMGLSALAKHSARGQDYLVLVRPVDGRFVMQQLYHSDEVRPVQEVPAAERKVSEAELKLAKQLIEQIATKTFEPEKYEDQVRKRVKAAIAQKVKGRPVARVEARPTAKVFDLMEALRASLARKGAAQKELPVSKATPPAAAQRKSKGGRGVAATHRKAS